MDRYDFLIGDLKKFGPQAGWDMESDLRFARAIKHPLEKDIEQAVFGSGVWPVRKAYLDRTGITKMRLRALRVLVHRGLVKAEWTGMGEGSFYEFGVRRDRVYSLRETRMT